MILEERSIPGLFVLESPVHGDERGLIVRVLFLAAIYFQPAREHEDFSLGFE